ncbi:hypothetical protein M407DRAFT_241372 [Tulasnella calospora MUT 4182]|uniref:Uridylate kinase n=1 Tax=Tulasnella calospora MUT 4182 TaxID=1051891 RepID=A0A0C3QJH8_9AGAM|nr:hypothetical protein M407DRAFT_241372 [Tulasnella calospora MUT 4182]
MGVIQKVKDALHIHKDPAASSSGAQETVFDAKKVTVIFVLGGPGVGKGTQCANLVRDYGFVHLSAGDLLRAEQNREGSEYGQLIRDYIREGQIVPMEVTVKLLENAIREALENPKPDAGAGWSDGQGRFLIDGFPRKMDQALKFDESVCPSAFVLFFKCSEEVMLQRLLERGKTSGREDDNVESIKKRFRTFEETSMPVVEMYREKGKTVELDAEKTIPEVYVDVKKAMDAKFAGTGVAPKTETTAA